MLSSATTAMRNWREWQPHWFLSILLYSGTLQRYVNLCVCLSFSVHGATVFWMRLQIELSRLLSLSQSYSKDLQETFHLLKTVLFSSCSELPITVLIPSDLPIGFYIRLRRGKGLSQAAFLHVHLEVFKVTCLCVCFTVYTVVWEIFAWKFTSLKFQCWNICS